MDEFVQFLLRPATPLWVAALIALIALVRSWPAIMAKVNEARRDSAQIADSLLDRLERRVKVLEDENEECHKSLANAERRLAALEGYNDGQGQARQEAAGIVAVERQKERDRRAR